MAINGNSEILFSEYSFELLKKWRMNSKQNEQYIYNDDDYSKFIKYVQQPFVRLCQLVLNNLPSQIADTNFDNLSKYWVSTFTNKTLSSNGNHFRLRKYLDILSLLYIEITETGVIIAICDKAGEVLAKQISDRHPVLMSQIIAKDQAIFYNLSIENYNYIRLSKDDIINQTSLAYLVSIFDEWLQDYIPLLLLATSNNTIPAIRQYLNPLNQLYILKQCAEETGFTQTEIQRWIRAINRHNQAIIYGPPGTGKTFVAEKLAQYLIGGGNGFSELVRFHPAYSYEDFIQGIRPQSENGQLTYPLVPGRFLKFCEEAEKRQGICVLIIDEINRANLAQVFGELMYLLEYRDKEISLASGNTFRIPKNVRIIGTMNTADRSIAEFDYALRRRFSFISLYPNYEVLRQYHQKTGLSVEGLIATLQRLNQAIADKNYEIGISFFLTETIGEDIEDIWCMEIEPYLEEYFFNQPDKVDEFRWKHVKKNIDLCQQD